MSQGAQRSTDSPSTTSTSSSARRTPLVRRVAGDRRRGPQVDRRPAATGAPQINGVSHRLLRRSATGRRRAATSSPTTTCAPSARSRCSARPSRRTSSRTAIPSAREIQIGNVAVHRRRRARAARARTRAAATRTTSCSMPYTTAQTRLSGNASHRADPRQHRRRRRHPAPAQDEITAIMRESHTARAATPTTSPCATRPRSPRRRRARRR